MKKVHKIYARTDEQNRVIRFFSTVFEKPLGTDILVEEGNEEYHVHVQLKYSALTMSNQYKYKIVDGAIVERTQEELAQELEKEQSNNPPSLEQRMSDIEEAVALMAYGE